MGEHIKFYAAAVDLRLHVCAHFWIDAAEYSIF
ncbi:MAG: hypothetical protein JWL84_3480 [Rhodospirillales bacterium]|nr:hypothetical protein [Rhodospirillales bacterium]